MPAERDDERAAAAHPEETDEERITRNLQELLQELRVALPGVQVLFAFLLTVPFSQRALANPFEQRVYLVTLLCAAIATALLIAPSAQHRVVFRQREREHLVEAANRLTLWGLAFLAFAMTGAVLLVVDVIFSRAAAYGFAGATFVLFAVFWYAVPYARLRIEGK
jgi:hypothetical protein